ncbi:hypothetical protein BDZ91DRAFT_742463 [Kalaharituber pfeilii]|nr:hypothetical protein BDZ91DRAFT_742463 [Kalaharituber pfeilii]
MAFPVAAPFIFCFNCSRRCSLPTKSEFRRKLGRLKGMSKDKCNNFLSDNLGMVALGGNTLKRPSIYFVSWPTSSWHFALSELAQHSLRYADTDCCTFCTALPRQAISSSSAGRSCVLERIFGFSNRRRSLGLILEIGGCGLGLVARPGLAFPGLGDFDRNFDNRRPTPRLSRFALLSSFCGSLWYLACNAASFANTAIILARPATAYLYRSSSGSMCWCCWLVPSSPQACSQCFSRSPCSRRSCNTESCA